MNLRVWLQQQLRRWLTPALLFGSVAAWSGLRASGGHLLLSTLGVTTGVCLLLYVAEQILPYEEIPPRGLGTLVSDLVFNVITSVSAVMVPSLVLVPVAHALGASLGTDVVWPRQLPGFLDVILCLLFVDFTTYWWHRIEHTTGESFAWRLHSVHHAPNYFDVWMGARVHPLDVIVFACVGYSLVALLGAPVFTVEFTAFFASMVGAMHHTRLATDCGWFNRVIPMADHHVMHHSARAFENGNFGNITTLFDQIFGSYLPPAPRDPPPIGAHSLAPDYPHNKVVLPLLSPFSSRSWRRLTAPK